MSCASHNNLVSIYGKLIYVSLFEYFSPIEKIGLIEIPSSKASLLSLFR